jgi:plasmid stabilization system protein ParE
VKYHVIVSREAENDLKEIFSWYEDTRLGLGYDFLLQVDAGINFIKRNPGIHPIEYKGTRKHLIKRFPYKIIYFVKEEKIIILAALHGKRSVELLKNRVDSS